jgi:hypothetical protein
MNRRHSRKSAMVSVESLEPRMMLTAAPATGATADAARRYVDALLIGVDLTQPKVKALREQTTSSLGRGANRQRVVLALQQSRIHDAGRVESVYNWMLDRDPTSRELKQGKAVLDGGQDERALAKQLASTAEFYKRIGGGTAVGFVTALDERVLRRDPTDAEIARVTDAASRPAARRRLAAAVIDGREYRTALAKSVLAQEGAAPSAQDFARAVRVLATPGGLVRLQAQVMSSQAVYDHLSAAPTAARLGGSRTSPTSGITGLSLPSFTSANATMPAPPSGQTYSIATAAADGSYYVGGAAGLELYTRAQRTWSRFGDGQPTLSASAVSASEIWTVEQPSGGGGKMVLVHYVNGNQLGAQSLPSGASPAQVSAASDGTVWVVDTAGSIFTLSTGSSAWSSVAGPNGAPVTAVAVGSATNIWALSGSATASQLYRYTAQTGWISDPTFPAGQVTSIYACSDGTAWLVANGNAYSHPPLSSWFAVNQTSIPDMTPVFHQTSNRLLFLAPTSQFHAYSVTAYNWVFPFENGPAYYSSSIGLVDQQPASAFPSWTAVQQQIYNYMSSNIPAGENQNGGIRGAYPDLTIDLDAAREDLIELEIPNGANQQPLYSTADWNSVVLQLRTELEDVADVRNLFVQINNLNTAVQNEQATILPGIEATIAAGTPGPSSSSTVDIVLQDLFGAVLAGVTAAVGVAGPAAAVAGAVISSGLEAGVTSVNSASGNGGGGNSLAIAYGQFSNTLGEVFTAASLANATYESTITGDYGRLVAAAALINSQAWYWDSSTVPKLAAAAEQAYTLNDYLALVPAQWQISEFHGPVPSWTSDNVYQYYKIPQGSSIVTLMGYNSSNYPMYDVLFSSQVGSPSNVFDDNHLGPFITSSLLATIGSLPGHTEHDFWSRQNGWENVHFTFETN